MAKKKKKHSPAKHHRRRPHSRRHSLLGEMPQDLPEKVLGIGGGAILSQMGALEADKHYPNANPILVGAIKIGAGAFLPDLMPSEEKLLGYIGDGFIAGGAIDIATALGAFSKYGIPAYKAPVNPSKPASNSAAMHGAPRMNGYTGPDQGGLGEAYRGPNQGGLGESPRMNGAPRMNDMPYLQEYSYMQDERNDLYY